MFPVSLLPGDVFAVRTDTFAGKLIRLRDRIRAQDGEAEYNHAGIIIDSHGSTFESRRRIDLYHINECAGCKVIIARPDSQQFFKDAAIRKLIASYEGRIYPWWRIILHAATPTWARYLNFSGVPVCSELVAEFEHLIGTLCHSKHYGYTPDMLVDEWRHWREYTVIFDGEWPKETGDGD